MGSSFFRDPNFPDRPDHPDFWRLSNVVLANDGKATEGRRSTDKIIGEFADFKSVFYMARNRASMVGDSTSGALSAWLDGFAAGVAFQREGGHRE